MADDFYQAAEDRVLVVAAASGVLANDGGGTVTSGRLTTSAGGRIASFEEDGAFAYAPPRGFSGTDTVDYERDVGGTPLTSTITFTVAAVADSPILRMADASVLGLTLSSADNASVPAGTSSSAVVTVPQVLALHGGGYAATIFVQDGANSIYDSYLQVFGANGQPSGALLPFDGPEIVDHVPLVQITDGRFMAAWRPSVGDPAPVSYRMFNADGTPATGVLTFADPATVFGSVGSVLALSNDNYAISYFDRVAGQQVQFVDSSGTFSVRRSRWRGRPRSPPRSLPISTAASSRCAATMPGAAC